MRTQLINSIILLCFLIGFLIGSDLQAQQMERLLCEPSWWQSNPSEQAFRNVVGARPIDNGLQLCNDNNDRPIHIVLKLEGPLSQIQWSFLMAIFRFEPNSVFLRNREGETPLILSGLRVGRLLEDLNEMGFDADINETQRFFQNFDREAELYISMRVHSGDLQEDVVNEIMTEITLIGLEHLLQQDDFLERLRESLENQPDNVEPLF